MILKEREEQMRHKFDEGGGGGGDGEDCSSPDEGENEGGLRGGIAFEKTIPSERKTVI